MNTYYVYDEHGNNIAVVYADDLLAAQKEAAEVTGIDSDILSVVIS